MIAMLSPHSNVLSLEMTPSAALSSLSGAFVDLARFQLPARGGLPPRALRRVRDYILSHLEETISIEALAAIVGLSKFHFARAFKQSEGVTPHQFLLQSRVKRVQELLSATRLPVSEIALAAGFSDQSHCSRCFRKLVGVTPSRYRWSTR
jgi:transcriptional regulator GlxA family with amidase domain